MKLVIDIPEYLYDRLHDIVSDDYALDDYELAIFNGTQLPDGAEILTKEAYSDLCMRAADVPDTNVGKLDGDPIDTDKAVEHYDGTLEVLKGVGLEVGE